MLLVNIDIHVSDALWGLKNTLIQLHIIADAAPAGTGNCDNSRADHEFRIVPFQSSECATVATCALRILRLR